MDIFSKHNVGNFATQKDAPLHQGCLVTVSWTGLAGIGFPKVCLRTWGGNLHNSEVSDKQLTDLVCFFCIERVFCGNSWKVSCIAKGCLNFWIRCISLFISFDLVNNKLKDTRIWLGFDRLPFCSCSSIERGLSLHHAGFQRNSHSWRGFHQIYSSVFGMSLVQFHEVNESLPLVGLASLRYQKQTTYLIMTKHPHKNISMGCI